MGVPPRGAVLTLKRAKTASRKDRQRFMPAGVHAGCSALVLCLIWLCILSRVSDKNLKLAAMRVNTNIFVIFKNSIKMGKENSKGSTPPGNPIQSVLQRSLGFIFSVWLSDLRQTSLYGTEISEIWLKKCQRLGMLGSPWLRSSWFSLASAST